MKGASQRVAKCLLPLAHHLVAAPDAEVPRTAVRLTRDARNRRRPTWISEKGFRTTTMVIQTTAEVPFRVFKKVIHSGPAEVVLGGNEHRRFCQVSRHAEVDI